MKDTRRSVLVTGCSDGGMGSCLAFAFYHAGYRVFATARDPTKLGALEAAGIETLSLDIMKSESIASCVAQVSEELGGSLNMLVNNAGGGYNMPLMDISVDRAKKLFDLNVWQTLEVTRAFMPLLLEAATPDRPSVVVDNTSAVSVLYVPFQGIYNASKAALAMLNDVLRLEMAPFNVKVVELKTSLVRTNFYDNMVASHGNTLPEDSLYAVARERVELALTGAHVDNAHAQPPEEWARLVVADLSKRKTPIKIWRGKGGFVNRLAALLPAGALDGMFKRLVGLDVVEKNLYDPKHSKVV